MTIRNPESGGQYNVPFVTDPPDTVVSVNPEKSGKASEIVMRGLFRMPWNCRFKIGGPDGGLEMDWRRAGSTAGYALWKSNDRPVAATAIFLGYDQDDCLAIERLARAAESTGPQVGTAFLKRLRENVRPLVGVAFSEAGTEAQQMIADFSMGLSAGLCRQFRVKQSRPALGPAIPQDFPPRFMHVLVTNGVIQSRVWAESHVFLKSPDLQQAVTTFMDRFDDSFEKFDERMAMAIGPGGSRHFRIEWSGLRPTAAMAEMTDDRQVRHTLLLLSGKEETDDQAVIDHFASTLPHFVAGLFQAPLAELRACPRPMLMDLVGADVVKDSSAASLAAAVGVAFFRRLGAF